MFKKKKYEAGAATKYINRTKALKKLQLTLNDFRRLCILKGIFPHEPAHKKRVNKGSTARRVWYYAKDIAFLAHEPIIQKFREYKVFLRKLTHYKAKREEDKLKKVWENKPEYQLDHIVKERYPTFGSALRELDDALCVLYVFATFPSTSILKHPLIDESRRLTAEFNHYIIESHSLVNSFVSIKGIYYQAEIAGEKITWIIPHERGFNHVTDVDFKVMATFAEFYIAMLSFVNYRLYQQLGLYYPPKIQTGENVVEAQNEEGETEEVTEKIYSLARPLARRPDVEEEQEQLDNFDTTDTELAERLKQAKAIRTLFKGCTFFLNREVPKEPLALLIRNCGGSVCWENGPVSIDEKSKNVTHQVVDRPMTKFDVSRVYIQPQWIWDSLNARRRLPTAQYIPGQTLPPHFSPFVKDKAGDYVPIERIEELKAQGTDVTDFLPDEEAEKKAAKKAAKPKKVKDAKTGMRVETGKMHVENQQMKKNAEGEDLKLREMMIKKRYKRVYHAIKTQDRKHKTEVSELAKKRARIEAEKADA